MAWKINKKITVLAVILSVLVFSAFSPSPRVESVQQHENNLKMLPKDITHDELMAIMTSFEVALNFDCGDCHAKSATNPNKLDFASDANPHKQEALEMMEMVEEINKKYFDISGSFMDNYLKSEFEVTCITCHNGHEEPSHTISVPVRLEKPEKE